MSVVVQAFATKIGPIHGPRLAMVHPQKKLRRASPNQRFSTAALIRDQRGATMVMGIFVAMLLVSMIYYVWGIGDAILYRERIQDAADTGSFTGAVIHARGMNMLALLNMIMAALATVAATFATIASMIGWATVTAAGVCAGCGPWCVSCCEACPYAVIHGVEWNRARNRSDRIDQQIETLMRGLRGYAIGIRNGVPLAAQARVVAYGAGVYSPVSTVGIMAPIRSGLPTEDDPTNWPCNEKVLPWVRILSPIGTVLSATRSRYLVAGIGIGIFADAPRHSRRWCRDGYFQRVNPDSRPMGGQDFQVQAYMVGSRNLEWSQQGAGIGTWGRDNDAGSMYSSMAEMHRISFAQAEFFYDQNESDYREWLWHMNWRARLRRWRLDDAGTGGLTEACGSFCSELSRIQELVVH